MAEIAPPENQLADQGLQGHLDDTVRPLLSEPWVLDCDTTIKPLYGHQEGAVVSYNPKKPGYGATIWERTARRSG